MKLFKSILIIPLLMMSLFSFSQEKKKIDYDLYGFINTQYFYKTRKAYSAVDGLFSLYPLAPNYNFQGKDLNAQSNHYLSSSTTRLGTRFRFLDLNNAKFAGVIEADFTGQAQGFANYLRLRHAYIKIDWSRANILIGQYWNPMTLPEMLPSNKDMHNGAPFHPFSRLYQIRFDYAPLQNLAFVSSLAFQRDYATIGIEGKKDYTQQINTFIPILNLHIRYLSNNIFAGVGGEFKAIKPREIFTFNGKDLPMNKIMYNYSLSAYLNYKTKNQNIKFQTIIGENLNDMTIIGGYYESAFDSINNKFNYKPIQVSSSWIDYTLSIGNFNPGIFMGYTKNLDISFNVYPMAYGLGMNIDNYYRISPRLEYIFLNKFSIAASIEYENIKFKDINKRIDMFKFGLFACYMFNY